MLGGSISSLQEDGTDCDSDFAPGEESDEDLDYDEEDDFIEGGMEFGANDLASRFGRVSLNGTNNATVAKNIPICYNVSEELTWLIYDFVQEDNHYCCVDIMTLAMGRDKFRPRVSTNGRKVMVEIVKPKFFFEYERLENINSHNSNFNVNTHKATAYKAALREMRRGLGVRKGEEITGAELVIPLPFQCEVDIVEWGVQGHANEDLEIRRITKDEQLYYILSMTFLSTEKAEEVEKKGTVKIVRKSPKKRAKPTSTRKKRKNDSFETASQGMPGENGDMEVDDNSDGDLSDGSEE